jgi:hypothetical protein
MVKQRLCCGALIEDAMAKPEFEAIDRLIDIVKEAIENGRASETELEQWLLAAIALEDLVEEPRKMRELDLADWIGGTLH